MQDLKFAIRQLAKSPGFTTVAVLTLALGIGANTTIFSLVNRVLLRPLPYDAPGQLVRVFESRPSAGLQRGPISPLNFRDWRSQAGSFEGLAAFNSTFANLTGSGEPERLEVARTSVNLFTVLRIHPLRGRAFSPDEEGDGRVVILSYRLWQRRFGGDPSVLGRTVTLDKESYSVVGVLPRDFRFFDEPDLWAPLRFIESEQTERGARFLGAVGRLKPGVGVQQARAEMRAIGERLSRQYTDNRDWGVELTPMREEVIRNVRPALMLLFAGVGLVLLIACGNLANLSLAKAGARQREIAMRVALGARRGRIIRQLLNESLLLSLCGGGLGIAMAVWGTQWLGSLVPSDLPRLEGSGLDGRVLGFTLLISILTGTLFGLVPALQMSRTDLNSTLKEGARGTSSDHGRLQGLCVISELALALILLACAGLLTRSFMHLKAVDPGFQADHLLTLQLSLPESKYARGDQQSAFFQQVVSAIARLPGVQHAAAAPTLPLSGGLNSYGFSIEGQAPQPGDHLSAEHDSVTADYFRTLGIRLVQGRFFTDRDDASSPPVIVINQAAARRFFPNVNPLGKRVTIAGPEPGEIVGVVADVKQYGLAIESPPHMYSPQTQKPSPYMTLFVRTSVTPMSLAPASRQAVCEVDKDQPVSDIRTLDEVAAASLAERRFTMMLLGCFAVAALTLAAVGIYGVMAFSVCQRSQEIGLRLALGAQKGDVLKLVIAQGMKSAAIGVAIGLIGALALTRMLSGMLFAVQPTDPFTLATVSLLLALVALAACWLPARRAARVDPMVTMRKDS